MMGACNAPLHMVPELPQRRSVRLPGFDYSQAGWYFVTIMAQSRQPLFGQVLPDATVQLTSAGEAVAQSWQLLGSAYPQVHADVWVLMPDHVHFIIGLLPTTERMRAKSLGQLVGAFKATATRAARPFKSEGSLWQRNYYEHIIRNAKELEETRTYISNNPRRWLERELASTHTA